MVHDRAQPLVDRLDGADLHDALDQLLNVTRHGWPPLEPPDLAMETVGVHLRDGRVREVRVSEEAAEQRFGLSPDDRIDRRRGLRRARVLAFDLDVGHTPHLEVAQMAVGQDRAARQQQATAAFEQIRGERHARLELLEIDSHGLRGTCGGTGVGRGLLPLSVGRR